MKKNFLQDVIPPNHKRTIRDIPLPKHKQVSAHTHEEKIEIYSAKITEQDYSVKDHSHDTNKESQKETFASDSKDSSVFNSETFHNNQYENSDQTHQPSVIARSVEKLSKAKNKRSATSKIVGSLLVVLIVTGFFVFFGRNNAVISLYAKQSDHTIDKTLTISSSGDIVSKTQITKTVSRTVPATQEQQIEQSAQGRIKIINKHKEAPQELVKNTRFQAPNGLIYRIKESIEIPGYTMSGATLVPGTLEVAVYADSAGEEYNISNTTFTIPGFGGMEQFDKITAETVGQITGGYIGIRKVVSPETKETIKKELEEDLKKQIESNSPDSVEYIVIPNITTLTYADLKDEAQGNSVTLTLSATVDAFSLKKQNLFNFIGQNTVVGASPNDVFTLDTENLIYQVKDESIQVLGNTTITWVIDIEKLTKDFVGRKKSEVTSIISQYKSFEGISVDLNPIWATKFPSEPSKIEILVLE